MNGVSPVPPSPVDAHNLDELVGRLRQLRGWVGFSEREVHRQVARSRRARGIPELPSYDTVHRCFQPGRTRLNGELLADIARVLLDGDEATVAQWRQAHARIVGEATAAAAPADATVSGTLPDDLPAFTGRRPELRSLLTPKPTPPLALIEGMAGVGKTTLAIRAAHLLRRRRRIDTALWVNLRGHAPDMPPADPAAVLEGLLRRLGMSADRIRALDPPGRAREFRRRLSATGGRMLVVLDNALSAEQVQPLLPHPDGLALVTSRHRLTELPGARRLPLETFTPEEALELLRRATGTERGRIDDDPGTAMRIAASVGHLPLALGTVASRIRTNRDWTLADHLDRLNDHRARLTFDDGVEVALRLSYEGLGPECRRLLRMLALHPGLDLDAYAAAALAGSGDVEATGRRLDALVSASLLRRPAPGRYEFHDLVRLYATRLARDQEPARARRAAFTRLLEHHRRAASSAMDHYAPHERHLRPPAAGDPGGTGDLGTPTPPLADWRAATAWLEAERGGLVATAVHATEHGHCDHAVRLSLILARYLDISGHYQEAEALHRHAARTSEPHGRAQALARLGAVAWRVGRYDEAADAFRRAMALFRKAGDRVGEGWMLGNLGEVEQHTGRFEKAGEFFGAALAIAREIGSAPGERRPGLGSRGIMYEPLGRYPKFYAHGEKALAMGGEILAVARTIGDRLSEENVLGSLGSIHRQLGRHLEAVAQLRQALAIARETENHLGRVQLLNELGTAQREAEAPGTLAEALRHHQEAAAFSAELGDRYEQARAHDGIAHCHVLLGDRGAARAHWQRTLTLFTELGTPEADDVAARLRACRVAG